MATNYLLLLLIALLIQPTVNCENENETCISDQWADYPTLPIPVGNERPESSSTLIPFLTTIYSSSNNDTYTVITEVRSQVSTYKDYSSSSGQDIPTYEAPTIIKVLLNHTQSSPHTLPITVTEESSGLNTTTSSPLENTSNIGANTSSQLNYTIPSSSISSAAFNSLSFQPLLPTITVTPSTLNPYPTVLEPSSSNFSPSRFIRTKPLSSKVFNSAFSSSQLLPATGNAVDRSSEDSTVSASEEDNGSGQSSDILPWNLTLASESYENNQNSDSVNKSLDYSQLIGSLRENGSTISVVLPVNKLTTALSDPLPKPTYIYEEATSTSPTPNLHTDKIASYSTPWDTSESTFSSRSTSDSEAISQAPSAASSLKQHQTSPNSYENFTTTFPSILNAHQNNTNGSNVVLPCTSNNSINDDQSSRFLVRTVLSRENLPKGTNITDLLRSRLERAFNQAYRKQFHKLGAKLNRQLDHESKVKLWNIFWNNSTNELHVVYQVEQNGHRLLSEDIKSILTHINDQEMANILEANVTIKAESYTAFTQQRIEGGMRMIGKFGELDWLTLSLVAASLVVLIFCITLSIFLCNRNRRLDRQRKIKEISNHRTGPKESFINWRKVSAPGNKRNDTSRSSGTIDSNHEFEYLSFDTPDSSLNLRSSESNSSSRHKRRLIVQSNQARLNLAKEKVVQIGPLLDASSSGSPSSGIEANSLYHPSRQHDKKHRTTYISTKEEMIGSHDKLHKTGDYHREASELAKVTNEGDSGEDTSCVPQFVNVQMNEQTESIIKAIQSELKRFHPSIGNNSRENNSSDA